MRLTLRTMLAYLDKILEPEDAQEISKRVAESPKATALMHRIREVTRRLRLGAPSVADRSDGLDPNTVAEYLDNTLSEARVLDFEKVCFESDIQLAEVAACHQVLTLILGEPAEVEPASRQRMYQVPSLAASPSVSADKEPAAGAPVPAAKNGSVQAPPPAASAGDERADNEPAVPDFLREAVKPSANPRFVAVAAAVVLLAVLFAIWGRPLVNTLLSQDKQPLEPLARTTETTTDTTEGSERAKENSASKSPDGPNQALPVETKERATEKTAVEPAPVEPASPIAERLKAAAAGTPPSGGAAPGGLQQPPGVFDQPARARPAADPAPRQPDLPHRPATVERLGSFEEAGQVLLKEEASSGAWERIEAGAPVHSGSRLLALPAFRPTLNLACHLRVQLLDGASVNLLPADAEGLPTLVIEYGRILLAGDGAVAEPRMRLQIGERSGTLTLQDRESALAIEVGRVDHLSGDPETQPGAAIADFYVTTGKVLWKAESEGSPVTLTAPVRTVLSDQPVEAGERKTFPKWVYDPKPSALDERASPLVERVLAPGRAVNLGLRELAITHRQKEVRGLAMRCLSQVGDFEPLIQGLNDVDQWGVWTDYIELLRGAVQRNTQTAARVRTSMEKLYPEKGANLYSLLWKYRAEDLTAKDADQLIRLLDDEVLAFRVLAIWNLEAITSMRFKYQPADPANRRQASIQRWRERQRSMPTLVPASEDVKEDSPKGGGAARCPLRRLGRSPQVAFREGGRCVVYGSWG